MTLDIEITMIRVVLIKRRLKRKSIETSSTIFRICAEE
jgi:hypothetical protein